MRARRLFGFAVSSATLFIAFACSSVPEVTFSDDPTNPDGNPPNEGGFIVDAGGDTNFTPTPCGTSGVCIDNAPAGWTSVILEPNNRPPCPAGYATPTELRVVSGNGNFTCSCECTGTGGTNCTGGSHSIEMGTDNACATGTPKTFNATTNNNCEMIGMYDSLAFAKLVPPAGPVTCTGADTDKGSRIQAKDGVKCVLSSTASVGGGCSATQVCRPKPSTGFLICVAKAGLEACPTGYTKQHRTGTNLTDGRTCSGCTCTTGPCTGEVEIWSQPNCGGASDTKINTTIHASCASATAVNNVKSYKSKIAGGCAQGASTASGQLNFGNEETICCK